jgi:HSP20 family protein
MRLMPAIVSMTKVKRSFLEKLTGARKIDGQEQYEERPNQEDSMPIYAEEREEMIATYPQEETTWQPARQQNDYDNSEGQLTIDVYQTENDIVIKSTIAGVKPEDLDVSISNDMISIKGDRKNEEQVPDENYYYQECYWGTFSRSVVLPVDVISEKSEASLKNGILTIRLPKADVTKTKKIQVRGF